MNNSHHFAPALTRRRLRLWVRCVTLGIILGLLLLPTQRVVARDDGDPDHWIFGCVIIVIAAVVVISLVKVCKKLPLANPPPPTEPPPPAPPTNAPPPVVTNRLARAELHMSEVALQIFSSPTQWQVFVLSIQSTRDLANPHWVTEHWVTNWVSDSMAVSLITDGVGRPMQTNWAENNWLTPITNDFGGITAKSMDARKFYRMELVH